MATETELMQRYMMQQPMPPQQSVMQPMPVSQPQPPQYMPMQQPQPSPQQYMPMPMPMPMQQQSSSGMSIGTKLIIGLIVVGLIILLVVLLGSGSSTSNSAATSGLPTGPGSNTTVEKPIDGKSGGVTGSGHPSPPPSATDSQVIKVPKGIIPGVKVIELMRDTSNTNIPASTFQVAEVKVFTDKHEKLNASHFESLVYNHNEMATHYPASNLLDDNENTFAHTGGKDHVQFIRMTLKNPTNVKSLEIVNRKDCCKDRLNHTVVNLLNSSGKVLRSWPLGGNERYIVFDPNYEAGV
jgi:hypothetical protein